MTEEEKYQEIVNSRKASEEKKPEDTKPKDDPSGVKTDPPAEKQPEPGKKPDESKPQGDGKKPDEQKGEGPAKPSEKEMQEHAFAKMRLKHKKESDELRAQIAELNKKLADMAPKPQAKTRKDFESDEAYEKHIRDSLKDEIRAEIMKEVNSSRTRQDEKDKFTAKLRGDLETTFGTEVADKVFTDLSDPESEMTALIQDEQAKPIVDAVMGSRRRADLLALMQAKPQIFQSMLELSPQKMAYRVFQLEDQIEARYAALAAKKQDEEKKKAVADSLPTPGAFGTQGNGNNGIQGLSTQQRVDRYKKELLDARTRH